jgi:hypothetical protein
MDSTVIAMIKDHNTIAPLQGFKLIQEKVGRVQVINQEYIKTKIIADPSEKIFPILGCRSFMEIPIQLKPEEIYLLGMILTDAHYTATGGIEIYQSAKKHHVVEQIDNALSRLNLKGSLTKRERNGRHYTWRIYKEYADELKSLLDLQMRDNPSMKYIFMKESIRGKLLNAMMDGDGNWNNWERKYGTFYKPSVIDFFQILAFSLGYRSKTNRHRKQIYISRADLNGQINREIAVLTMENRKQEMFGLTWGTGKTQEAYPLMLDNGSIFIIGG